MKISCVSLILATLTASLKCRLCISLSRNDDSFAAKRGDNDDKIWKFYDLEMQIWQLNFWGRSSTVEFQLLLFLLALNDRETPQKHEIFTQLKHAE